MVLINQDCKILHNISRKKISGCQFVACRLHLKRYTSREYFRNLVWVVVAFFKVSVGGIFVYFLCNVIILLTRRDECELGWCQNFPLFQPYFTQPLDDRRIILLFVKFLWIYFY